MSHPVIAVLAPRETFLKYIEINAGFSLRQRRNLKVAVTGQGLHIAIAKHFFL
jgi:hypothetical protein